MLASWCRLLARAALLSWLASSPGSASPGPAPMPGYLGSAACQACHPAESAAWRGSHHEKAMQEATPETVLGNFDGAVFEQAGVRSRFFRRDGRFMVKTDGPDGELAEFEISHTFGVHPLQQYLVPFPGGRLQVLDIAWDARPAAEGGQRWFHLHPDEPIPAGDVLHWTGPNLNWNSMCADCHSTQLRKGYQPASDRYATTWAEISVGCEACHGPGRDHAAWAEAGGSEPGGPRLRVELDERRGVAWSPGPDGRPRRSAPRRSDTEIQACARCHSRRAQLTDAVEPGQALSDGFRPALISPDLYHPDGQVREEVYVWGSFLQSRMQHEGVTCSDCHDPHSAELRAPGNATCLQCHGAAAYDAPDHHFHPQGSAGAQCAACHMPTTTFMGVDARHEHAFRVPRPDLSAELGTPNACGACHAERGAAWAAAEIRRRHGEPHPGAARFARAMAPPGAGGTASPSELGAIGTDAGQPVMWRASALAALAAHPGSEAAAVREGLGAADPLLRLGALAALETAGARQRVEAFPLLSDPALAVRIAAARLLAPLPPGELPAAERARLDGAIAEYVAAQEFQAERPEAHANLGALYAEMGQPARAESAFREALKRQPLFVPARVALAQLLGQTGRESQGEALLRAGLEPAPGQPDLTHALALSLVRQGRHDDALPLLRDAARGAPGNPGYAYAYALALHARGDHAAAVAELRALHEAHPANPQLLYALATIHRDAGELDAAREAARQLVALRPDDPRFQALLRSLEAR